HDRDDIALILIGMPGLEKQFSHYPQFYSRVGFAHQYRPLGQDELLFVLERHWRSLGKTLDPDDFTDAQAIAAIARITRGNFRLLERLAPQDQRVLKHNELGASTNHDIEAAQSTPATDVTRPRHEATEEPRHSADEVTPQGRPREVSNIPVEDLTARHTTATPICGHRGIPGSAPSWGEHPGRGEAAPGEVVNRSKESPCPRPRQSPSASSSRTSRSPATFGTTAAQARSTSSMR